MSGQVRQAAPAAWVRWGSVALCAAGVALGIYLVIEHFTANKALVCPEGSVINCQKVTQSSQAVILGVPVAVLGLVFFAAMLTLSLPMAWRTSMEWLGSVRLGGAAVGVFFVLYLIYVELFELNAICLWCTVVHVVTIALFAILAIGAAQTQ